MNITSEPVEFDLSHYDPFLCSFRMSCSWIVPLCCSVITLFSEWCVGYKLHPLDGNFSTTGTKCLTPPLLGYPAGGRKVLRNRWWNPLVLKLPKLGLFFQNYQIGYSWGELKFNTNKHGVLQNIGCVIVVGPPQCVKSLVQQSAPNNWIFNLNFP